MKTWLFARLSEATTWGGLSSFALLLLTQMPPGARPYDGIAAALFAGLAVVMREKGTKTPDQILADAVAAGQAVRSATPPVAALLLAAGASLLACVTAAAAVPFAPLPVESVTPRAVLVVALAVIALLWILALALFTVPRPWPVFARAVAGIRALARVPRRAVVAGMLALGLVACGTDPVADVIAGYTAADSAAATYLAANTNADAAAKVKACEAAAYGVLAPVKTAWVAGTPVASDALSTATAALAIYQGCLTTNGVKL